jgi:hypothetical protein
MLAALKESVNKQYLNMDRALLLDNHETLHGSSVANDAMGGTTAVVLLFIAGRYGTS